MKYPDDYINKIINGDCLEVMKNMPDKSVDMILCDLPYGITNCEWDSIIPLERLWSEYKRLIKRNGAIVLTASQPFTSILVSTNINMFRYDWVWEKERPTNPLLCKKQPPKYTESILVFSHSQPNFYPTMIKRKEENKRNNKPRTYKDATKTDTGKYAERVISGANDFIYQPNILRIPMERGLHPTQKPVALFKHLVRSYTKENEVVLDNCLGSGTTAVACKQLNRNFIGIEISKKYCEIAQKRLDACTQNLF